MLEKEVHFYFPRLWLFTHIAEFVELSPTDEYSSETDSACVVCARLCPTLCDPMDGSQPGSSVIEFSRKEFWSWLSFSPLAYLPDPAIEPSSPASPALAGKFFTTASSGKHPETDHETSNQGFW